MGILKTIVKFIAENIKLILFALLTLAVVLAFMYRDKYKDQMRETQKQKYNIEALQDSVRTYKTNNGELGQEKLALQTDKEQLKTLNRQLSMELQKEKGEVEQLTQLAANLKGEVGDVDSTSDAELINEMINTANDLSKYKFTWSKEESGDKWRKVLEGYFVVEADNDITPQVIENKITRDELSLEIITGIRNVDDQRTIFVRSTYPGLNFTDINGAILSENALQSQRKRWGIGPYLGIGMGVNGKFHPTIGLSINYDIIKF